MSSTTELVIIVLALGLIPAVIAANKGHSFFGWWLFGIALWIVATPMAIMLERGGPNARPCPYCRQSIPREAAACSHCTRAVTPIPADAWVTDCPGCHAQVVLAAGTTDWTCWSCGAAWSMPAKLRRAKGLAA